MKKVLIALMSLMILLMCTSCNRQLFDTTQSFDKAIILLPNGNIVEGKVQSWTDFEDGDQLQIKIDGVTYLTFASNVVLIND